MIGKTSFVAGLTALAVVALQAPAHAVPDAQVLTMFDFSGTCRDCTGVATGQLVLQNYALGDPITTSNFYSFTYNGTDLQTPFTIVNAFGASGEIDDNLPGPQNVFIDGTDANNAVYVFTSSIPDTDVPSGSWSVSYAGRPEDQGTGPSYAAPEPVSISLLGAGLLSLGIARRRRSA